MSATSHIDALKQAVEQHPFLRHPLLQQLQAVTPEQPLTREQGRRFALLYYPHILRTRLYQASALGVIPDENMQFVLSDILYDEYGNGDLSRSHMEIYRKFMRAMAISEADMAAPPIIPELQGYIDTMMRLSQGEDWLAAFAAVGIAGEWPIPPYYTILLQALRTIPGIAEDDLELFSSHIDLDVEHSKMAEDVLVPFLDDEAGRQSVWRGIELNLNARLVLLSGLQRELFAAE